MWLCAPNVKVEWLAKRVGRVALFECLSISLYKIYSETQNKTAALRQRQLQSSTEMSVWSSWQALCQIFFIADVGRMLTIKTMTNHRVHCTCLLVDRRYTTTGGRHDALSVPTSAAVAAAAAAGSSRASRILSSWQMLTECCVRLCVLSRLGKQSVMISYDMFPYRVVRFLSAVFHWFHVSLSQLVRFGFSFSSVCLFSVCCLSDCLFSIFFRKYGAYISMFIRIKCRHSI